MSKQMDEVNKIINKMGLNELEFVRELVYSRIKLILKFEDKKKGEE